ncbi:MAG TPA: hypothetical protein VG325_20080 [Solirubrobacteraceae bacterium]|nr:hypothetical protein [Solirubrobacteraceae bacterium]
MEGFESIERIRAARPHVDRFPAGHIVARPEELAAVLADIERRHTSHEERKSWRLS